jgi:S-(hydroxymethyl)glutathione dehydrogenase/alcohol dehydrogenase
MKAAVLHPSRRSLVIHDVEIDRPREREVVVRTVASGVCHSDLHYLDRPAVLGTGAVLGHEVAGIVEETGSQVRQLSKGDHVIGCLSAFCGDCEYCLTGRTHLCSSKPGRGPNESPRLSLNGQALFQFGGLGAFAEKMLVHENGLVKISESVPLDVAALLGCGVTTGVGAVLNTAQVKPGSTVAVFGSGGIGSSVIQGAKIAGARMIIAVDTSESKLASARELGATHVIDATLHDPVQDILDLTEGGVDYGFEAIGLKETVEQSYECLRAGGTATIIGILQEGQVVELNGRSFLREKKIQGCSMGSNRFKIDMPRYLDFYAQGRLKLDELITRRVRLQDVNEAFRALKEGEVLRTMLMFD